MDPLAVLRELAETWQQEAELLRHRGAPRQAKALESAADELENRLREWRHEELTVQEAAEESGYSPKTLRRMVREGRIPDSRPDGSRSEIRIRRRDLPRKPGSERDPVTEAVDRHVQRVTGGEP